MTARVQFHFDFGSPNTYYCHKVIPEIEARTGVKFEYFPILLGGIFKSTNNKSPMEQFAGVKNKNEYQVLETERFKKKHEIKEFKMNPNFPVNTLYIMRGAIHAQKHGFGKEYIDRLYSCMWEQGLKMDDPQVIHKALSDCGLPADEIIAGAADPEIKQQLIDNTNQSVERGTFGSPTFYVEDEIFFGKDKLEDVEAEILTVNQAS
ncbi:MAG: 2-hydroxychromene-2-carboxylate isomerase [Gammaproteobacteria bacterium]|mgnify:FL=1|jgi:2-hydroxychromene-2-carboxylate isomerase|nr:2-hydroxychromene-2-carboxylate isomerase [Gammaproteobacteria bacterium]MBT3860454.1 2-hydroxychromene-2-carboxylate isomerase [Gammaproteobacteria bacterium]MBT3987903.1 2-hydroxychromene-2-carboxylate isomerase [Gammaproteobacteria bacterium]MBT4257151.1 2-hydroxychromene-2-carboxylate isomerase [Gammaproteobacteria bacterium]MBT4582430.1 2-hydroxychromene-2-carboxylate isomerase [Gammaproteobacteria bacterium]